MGFRCVLIMNLGTSQHLIGLKNIANSPNIETRVEVPHKTPVLRSITKLVDNPFLSTTSELCGAVAKRAQSKNLYPLD
jgi:hypothetical protein